jgi:hypothetical protein
MTYLRSLVDGILEGAHRHRWDRNVLRMLRSVVLLSLASSLAGEASCGRSGKKRREQGCALVFLEQP